MVGRILRGGVLLLVMMAGFGLLVVAPTSAVERTSDWTCAPQGRTCTFDSDCCSKHCVHDPKIGKVCKPKGASWTCAPLGRQCTFNSNCCSKNCVSDPKLGKVCKPKGASWTCVPQGRTCTFSSDCCSKNCVHDPKIGKVCKQPKKG